MSFFGRLFGAKAAKALDPVELREQLFDAAAEGGGALEKLCRSHREAIPSAYATWTTVPVEIRSDQRAVHRYMTGMIAVGQCFAEQFGDPSLMQRLMPPGKANPLARWQEQLAEARELMAGAAYTEAEPLLAAAVDAARGLTGTGVDRLLPQTLGALGECLFQQGQSERALAPMTQALALCREQGDADGVRAYLGNLYEVSRYLGNGEAAASNAESLASLLESAGDTSGASRYRHRAALARSGEPLNRVLAVFDGREYEVTELPEAALEGRQSVKFVFERNRLTLRPALELTRKAEALAVEGEYERALTTFRAAAAADLHDPGAHFLTGLTLLHLKRPAEAVASYDACEARAPGWYVCRADRWLAQQIAVGRYDLGAFLALNALESERSASEKEACARQSLERYPDLAGLHLELGKALSGLDRAEAAKSAYREGLRYAEDPDTRTRLLVALAALSSESEAERQQLLLQAVDLRGNLVSAAQASFLLRAARAN
jgi:tetratricopeptide (TPR) repeat protein